MGKESIKEEEQLSNPLLLVEENCGRNDENKSSSTTTMVVFSTSVSLCGSYVFGSSVGYSSPAQSGIVEELGLTVAQYSLFGSILTTGAMIGAILSGKTADYIGRRGAMAISEIFCIVGWLCIAFSEAAWWLDLGRLLVGCGMGLLSYVVPIYIAELTPKKIRGGFTALHQFMSCCGLSMTYLTGAFMNWRTLALLGTIPCIMQLLGLYFIPESPRWLAMIGQEKKCEAALQRLRGENTIISQEVAEIRDYTETLQRLSEANIIDLFQRRYARSLIVGVGLMVLQQFGGINGIVFYANAIFVSAGFSDSVGPIAMVVVKVPMTALGVVLMDKSGRRPLLLVSSAGTCLGCFLVGLSYILQDLHQWKGDTPILALVGVLVYTGSFALGMGGIPWIIMSEIFPINMKGSAGSLVTLVSWLGSWIISFSFNFLMEWSSAGTFFSFSIICGLTIVFVAMFSLAPLKGASNHPVHQTLGTAANLANLLPTGTVLVFQTFAPSFSNNGLCRLPNKYLTAVLISVCATFCFPSLFTDTFVDSAGKLHYGIATFRGLYIFNLNIDGDNDQYGTKDLERFKFRFVDFVHAFVSLLLFLIFALGDPDMQGCYFSRVGTEWNSLFMNLPLGAGAFCTFLFTIFPATRRGIGYTDINAHSACSC